MQKPGKTDIVFSFFCQSISGELTLNEEARDNKYFAVNEIPENTVKKQVQRIKHFFESPKDIILMEQYDSGEEILATKYFL